VSVQQVQPWALFPSGDYRPLVMLRFDPEELADRYGLTFATEHDDLDEFKLAAIALPDGSQAWLTKYRGEQGPGATVLVDAGADFARAKELLLSTLGLTDADLLWESPFVAHREQRPRIARGASRVSPTD